MSTKQSSHNTPSDNAYQPSALEAAIQKQWQDKNLFKSTEDITKEKFYCLSMLPYPSGELHVGHVRNYVLGDLISRYQRMKGKNVMQPMGWDAFGLPAENAAIKHQLAPAAWTKQNIITMRAQLNRLGLAVDWDREITTCQPDYYHWEQWFFIQLYKKDLVYKKNAIVNWDPVDQTVLANEQVIDGRGWRSGALVERKEIPQWFIKTRQYAEELLNDLDELPNWPEQVKTMQRNWIGRSEGLEVQFETSLSSTPNLTVYTTRPDTLMGVSYLAVATEHPIAKIAAANNEKIQTFINDCQQNDVSEATLETMEKVGVATGLHAIHPITKELIPIWVANFVLMQYGTGAVMAVPAHDQRDFEFAQKYNLSIMPVITPSNNIDHDFSQQAFTTVGTLINSAQFDGLTSIDAKQQISDHIEQTQQGKCTTNYRLRDWGVSRQRYWGTPIPMIYCKACGTVPVPEAELPVKLPEQLIPDGKTSPLKQCTEFYQTQCPQCHQSAERETDTFDTFVESSWYYLRYCCPDQKNALCDDRAKYWAPVDQYIGGIEHAIMHLLYARLFHKMIRDLGLIHSKEPFARLLTQGMVLKNGAKMSKSKGNTVSPDALIKKYGADTLRFFVIFAAPPEQSLEWSDSGVEGAFKFLKRIHHFTTTHKTIFQAQLRHHQKTYAKDDQTQAIRRTTHQLLKQANTDMNKQQFNTVASTAMKLFNHINSLEFHQHIAVATEALTILLKILSPIAPHLTNHLWQQLYDHDEDISQSAWPSVDKSALECQTINLIIQINGKRRGEITAPQQADQSNIKQTILNDQKLSTLLNNATIKKLIIVPNRLVNVVI